MAVMGGLIEKEKISTSIKNQLQLICLGLVTQVLERLEDLDQQFQQEYAMDVESQALKSLGNVEQDLNNKIATLDVWMECDALWIRYYR